MMKWIAVVFTLLLFAGCGGGGGETSVASPWLDNSTTQAATAMVVGSGNVATTSTQAIGETRNFRMGLTPFAGDLTISSLNQAWDFVHTHGDLVALHFDTVEGLPWEQLESGEVPSPFRDQFEVAAANLGPGDTVYVALNPLNAARNGITQNYGGGAFPASMGAEDFSNPRLHTAFINYANYVVELLNPTYLAIGMEVNMFDLPSNPDRDFADFVLFYKIVYQDLKASYPDLIIFPTFQTEFMHGYDQWNLVSLFEPELDRIGISLYPSSVGYEPSNLPANWISRYTVSQSQPLVIAETGYGSRPFEGSYSAPGSETLQSGYVDWLIAQADSQDVDFMVWFFPSDVPDVPVPDGIPAALVPDLAFFHYMGLVNSNFVAKPALAPWDDAVSKPYRP